MKWKWKCHEGAEEDPRIQPLPVVATEGVLAWRIQFWRGALLVHLNATSEDPSSVPDHHLVQLAAELGQRLNACIHNYRKREPVDSHGEGTVDVEGCPPFEDVETVEADINGYVGQVQALLGGQAESEAPPPPVNSLQAYNDLFRYVPLPAVAENFYTDEVFAKLRVAGPNPMTIQGVTKSELCALIGERLSDEDFKAVLGTEDDSVEKAGEDGRLCVANYKMLTGTVPFAPVETAFVQDPIAVFAEPISGSDFIKPVAIQLGQDPETSEFILANTPDEYRWRIAKTVVQAADQVMFTLVTHVGSTHLIMESLTEHTTTAFTQDHPVLRLLAPHFEGTQFINALGGSTVLNAARGPAGDSIPILEGEDANSMPLVIRARRSFVFSERPPTVELAARKVEKLKVYPYRDDALLLWGAIKNWATDYVDLYFDDDDAVAQDEEIAAWSKAINDDPNLNGFVPPQDKEALSRALALIVYIATAQHSAVHYTNKDYTLYAPVAPSAVWGPIPPIESGPATEEDWIKTLPPIPAAAAQLGGSYQVGNVKFHQAGEYQTSRFPYYGTLDKKAAPALQKFKDELDSVEETIKKSNEERGSFSYEYMLPSVIQTSIYI